jgi:hypothetical protein
LGYDRAMKLERVLLWSIPIVGGLLVLRSVTRAATSGANASEETRENLRTSYDQCGAQVTIYERVSSTGGTLGYRAIVRGDNATQERLFGAAGLGEAMTWADALACS